MLLRSIAPFGEEREEKENKGDVSERTRAGDVARRLEKSEEERNERTHQASNG